MHGSGPLRRLSRSCELAIALLLPAVIRGQTSTAAPDLLQYYYPDVSVTCNSLTTCRLKEKEGEKDSEHQPKHDNRGLCVKTGQGDECWDVCNPNHKPDDYQVVTTTSDDVYNHIAQGMVSQVREGLNNNVTCPPELDLQTVTDTCPPGDLCPDKIRHEFNIKRGQGMCVVEPGSDGSRSCLDMCDFRIAVSRFGEAAPQGAALKVMQFRNSGACNGGAWIGWLIFFMILLLLVGCCGVAYYYRRRGFSFGKGRPSEFALKDQDFGAGQTEDELPPFEDQQQDRGYDEYLDGENEYGVNPPSGQPQQFQVPTYNAQPPQSFREPSYQPDSPSGAMRIPGLDEPHLAMPSMQPVVVPQAQAQVASADMIRSAAPFAPTSLSSSAGQVAYMTAPASPGPAFQTQMPTFSAGLTQPTYTSGSPIAYSSTPAGSIRIGAAPVSVQPAQYISQPPQRIG